MQNEIFLRLFSITYFFHKKISQEIGFQHVILNENKRAKLPCYKSRTIVLLQTEIPLVIACVCVWSTILVRCDFAKKDAPFLKRPLTVDLKSKRLLFRCFPDSYRRNAWDVLCPVSASCCMQLSVFFLRSLFYCCVCCLVMFYGQCFFIVSLVWCKMKCLSIKFSLLPNCPLNFIRNDQTPVFFLSLLNAQQCVLQSTWIDFEVKQIFSTVVVFRPPLPLKWSSAENYRDQDLTGTSPVARLPAGSWWCALSCPFWLPHFFGQQGPVADKRPSFIPGCFKRQISSERWFEGQHMESQTTSLIGTINQIQTSRTFHLIHKNCWRDWVCSHLIQTNVPCKSHEVSNSHVHGSWMTCERFLGSTPGNSNKPEVCSSELVKITLFVWKCIFLFVEYNLWFYNVFKQISAYTQFSHQC